MIVILSVFFFYILLCLHLSFRFEFFFSFYFSSNLMVCLSLSSPLFWFRQSLYLDYLLCHWYAHSNWDRSSFFLFEIFFISHILLCICRHTFFFWKKQSRPFIEIMHKVRAHNVCGLKLVATYVRNDRRSRFDIFSMRSLSPIYVNG